MVKEEAIYSHGHTAQVTGDHALRTAQDSAAFLLPHIQPHFKILDIGCGTGSITVGLAECVPQGSVIGGDVAESVVAQANERVKTNHIPNATFQVMDANSLPFEDGEFDVVYCHQVLHHVKDPVAILAEMRRVAKTGGIVAARETDYASWAWYPESEGMARFKELFQVVGRANGGEPNAGRRVHAWAHQAGFEPLEIEASWDAWRYKDDRLNHFANSWAARILQPGFAQTAKTKGGSSDAELEAVSEAWRKLDQQEDAMIAIPHGQIICRKTAR